MSCLSVWLTSGNRIHLFVSIACNYTIQRHKFTYYYTYWLLRMRVTKIFLFCSKTSSFTSYNIVNSRVIISIEEQIKLEWVIIRYAYAINFQHGSFINDYYESKSIIFIFDEHSIWYYLRLSYVHKTFLFGFLRSISSCYPIVQTRGFDLSSVCFFVTYHGSSSCLYGLEFGWYQTNVIWLRAFEQCLIHLHETDVSR